MSRRRELELAVDALPALTLTPLARALETLMSDLSEDCWAARWMDGTEYDVWDLLHERRSYWGMGSDAYMADQLASIAALAKTAGVWIVWRVSEGGTAVDLAAWAAIHGDANSPLMSAEAPR